jgi:hypothetical protein
LPISEAVIITTRSFKIGVNSINMSISPCAFLLSRGAESAVPLVGNKHSDLWRCSVWGQLQSALNSGRKENL